jgi:hypothetical protein
VFHTDREFYPEGECGGGANVRNREDEK